MSSNTLSEARPRGGGIRVALARAGRLLRTERGVVWAALSIVALHLVDENYLRPEPGTSPGDHIASGLIPLAILALAAWAYPRVRAGARAALAITFGALGIASGIPSAYYLSHDAAHGDHWTGLLAIAAGVVLALSAPVTLWRHRSRDESRKRRYRHRGLTALGIAVLAPVVFIVLVFPIGYVYVYTHSGRIVENPELGVSYQTVRFPTSDGVELTGYYVPSKNRAAVVLYPGASASGEARMLMRHGYGVLLVDPRGQGRSQGDINRWAGEHDLIAAAEYLQRRPDVDPGKIAGMGFSIGGEQLLEAAARSKAFAAVVSEGAGARVGGGEMLTGAAKYYLAPSIAVMSASMTVFQNDGVPPRTEDRIGRIAPRPVFLIYADPGMGGEKELQRTFFAAAGEPKQIWKVPGSDHTGGMDAQPAEYEQRATTFLDQALLER